MNERFCGARPLSGLADVLRFPSLAPLLEDFGDFDLGVLDWVRRTRDRCGAASVPFHFEWCGKHRQDGRWIGQRAAERTGVERDAAEPGSGVRPAGPDAGSQSRLSLYEGCRLSEMQRANAVHPEGACNHAGFQGTGMAERRTLSPGNGPGRERCGRGSRLSQCA